MGRKTYAAERPLFPRTGHRHRIGRMGGDNTGLQIGQAQWEGFMGGATFWWSTNGRGTPGISGGAAAHRETGPTAEVAAGSLCTRDWQSGPGLFSASAGKQIFRRRQKRNRSPGKIHPVRRQRIHGQRVSQAVSHSVPFAQSFDRTDGNLWCPVGLSGRAPYYEIQGAFFVWRSPAGDHFFGKRTGAAFRHHGRTIGKDDDSPGHGPFETDTDLPVTKKSAEEKATGPVVFCV